MGDNPKVVPRVVMAPTHAHGMRPCVVMTSLAVHTVEIGGKHYGCAVHDDPTGDIAVIVIFNRAEMEATNLLMRNAIADAERLDAGKGTIHAAGSEREH